MCVCLGGRGFIAVANQSARVQVWVHEGAYVEMSISVVFCKSLFTFVH